MHTSLYSQSLGITHVHCMFVETKHCKENSHLARCFDGWVQWSFTVTCTRERDSKENGKLSEIDTKSNSGTIKPANHTVINTDYTCKQSSIHSKKKKIIIILLCSLINFRCTHPNKKWCILFMPNLFSFDKTTVTIFKKWGHYTFSEHLSILSSVVTR